MHCYTILAEVLFVVCIFRVGAGIKGWRHEEYPNIFTDPYQCGRPYDVNDTWVCDPDGILTVDQGNLIDETLKQIQNNSNCLCANGCNDGAGFHIAVALLGWMTIEINFMPKKEQAYRFANYLMTDWFELKEDSCDNNVVMFYSYEHNQLAFALGSDVWPMVTELEYAHLVDSGRSRLGAERNSTFTAVDYVIRKLNDSIQNGPGIGLQAVYLMTVTGALVVLIAFMCLVSNTCCRVEIPRKLDNDKSEATKCSNDRKTARDLDQ